MTDPADTVSGSSSRWLQVLPWLVITLTACLYWITRAPGPIPGDSTELVTAAVTLGTCHPTGYPLPVLLGHLVTRLVQLASPAAVLNATSGAWVVIALGLLADAGRRLQLSPVAVSAGIAVLATTPTVWNYATFAEVYALQILLVAAVIWMAIRCLQAPSPGLAATLGLLVGLGFGNHMSTVFLLPALALWIGCLVRRHGRPSMRAVAFPAVAGLAAGSTVLASFFLLDRPDALNYVDQYAREFPDPRFARPWFRFFWMVTAEQYSASRGLIDGLATGEIFAGLVRVCGKIFRDAPVLLCLGGLGLAMRSRGSHRAGPAAPVSLAGFVVAAVSLLFYATYHDFEPVFFLAPYVFAALGVAMVVHSISSSRMRAVAAAALVVVSLHTVATEFEAIDKWGTELYEAETAAFLLEIEADAVVFATWRNSTLLWYATMVEGVNPTVTVVNATPDHWDRLAAPYRGRPWYLSIVPLDAPPGLFTPVRHFYRLRTGPPTAQPPGTELRSPANG